MIRIMALSLASLALLALSVFGGLSIYKQMLSIGNTSRRCDVNRTWSEVPFAVGNLSADSGTSGNPFAGSDCGYIDSENRIFAGNRSELFEFPWMALLGYSSTDSLPTPFLCAGSLITSRHVLTAAHCLRGSMGMQLEFVRLGEHDLRTPIDCDVSALGDQVCSPPHRDFAIAQTISHPEFSNGQNDIAIIVLAQVANTSQDNIKKICLPFEEQVQSANLTGRLVATGWGLTETGATSDVLLKTQMPLVPHAQCQRIYRNEMLTRTQFCAGGGLAKGSNGNTCLGDSGGPLQAIISTSMVDSDGDQVSEPRYYQFGVVSMGPTLCWARGQPTIHTRVIDFLPWIRDMVLKTRNTPRT